MFLDQSREAIELILEKWQSIPVDQKYEIAQYLIPEVHKHVYIYWLINCMTYIVEPQQILGFSVVFTFSVIFTMI